MNIYYIHTYVHTYTYKYHMFTSIFIAYMQKTRQVCTYTRTYMYYLHMCICIKYIQTKKHAKCMYIICIHTYKHRYITGLYVSNVHADMCYIPLPKKNGKCRRITQTHTHTQTHTNTHTYIHDQF